MAATPTGIPGIEQLSPNTYRVGTQVWTVNAEGVKVRRWIRETHTYPAAFTKQEQLQMAQQDLAVLKERVHKPEALVDILNPPPQDQLTIRQLTELWRTNSLGSKSADYIKTVDSLLSIHVLPQLGSLTVLQLTPLRISAWISQLLRTQAKNKNRTLSPRTVRHCYITLQTIYNWGVLYDIIDKSPFEKTEPPKVRKHKPAFLDDQQAVELLRHLKDEENMSFRCAVLLALMTGLRLGEVDALTWHDIDYRRGTIDISKSVKQTPQTGRIVSDPKTDEAVRLITAPAALLTLLDETRKDQLERKSVIGDRYKEHDLIVCAWDGSPLNKDTVSKQWRKYAQRHGYDGVTFHNLRTTHATLLLANNIDAVAVAGRMGHTDATTTLRFYAGLVAQRDKDSAAVMDSIAAQAGMTTGDQIPHFSATKQVKSPWTITHITFDPAPPTAPPKTK